MSRKFRGPEIVKEIDDMLDKGLARFVFLTQAKLSRSSPVKTGRLASSWFIGMDQPNREVEPERSEPGPVTITKDYTAKEITMKHNWWISSNLPYSQRAALDPGYVGRSGGGAGDWFTRVGNYLPNDAERAFDYFLKKVR